MTLSNREGFLNRHRSLFSSNFYILSFRFFLLRSALLIIEEYNGDKSLRKTHLYVL